MIRDGIFRTAGGSDGHGCVEVAALPAGGVVVRDSKDRGGPVLQLTDDEWRAFVGGARDGEFDLA